MCFALCTQCLDLVRDMCDAGRSLFVHAQRFYATGLYTYYGSEVDVFRVRRSLAHIMILFAEYPDYMCLQARGRQDELPLSFVSAVPVAAGLVRSTVGGYLTRLREREADFAHQPQGFVLRNSLVDPGFLPPTRDRNGRSLFTAAESRPPSPRFAYDATTPAPENESPRSPMYVPGSPRMVTPPPARPLFDVLPYAQVRSILTILA